MSTLNDVIVAMVVARSVERLGLSLAILAVIVLVILIGVIHVAGNIEARRIEHDREDAWRAGWLAWHREHEPEFRDNCPICRKEEWL